MSIFSKSKTITAAAAVIAVAGLISRLLGLVRDRVLASQFGAGDILDSYYAAFQVPDLIFNLIIFGALSAGFIPIFVGLLANEDKRKYSDNSTAWDFTNNVISIFGAGLIFFGVVFYFIAPDLLAKILPGFNAEKLALTTAMARVMFLSPIFLGMSAIVGGALQSYRRFLFFSFAPAMYNLGIIFGALVLVKYFGPIGLAYGVVAGAFLHLLIQLPDLIALGWRYRLSFKPAEKSFLKMLKMTGPRVLTMATNQINLLVVAAIASTLTAGSFAIFNFANNLQALPLGILGLSLAMAAFPVLSSAFAKKNDKEFETAFVSTFNKILFLMLPSSLFLILVSRQLVNIILQTGKFEAADAVMTSVAMSIFAVSLFAQALTPLISRAFFARQDTMSPFYLSVVSVLANILLSIYFSEKYGVLGLAAAFTVSTVLNFMLMLLWLKIKAKTVSFYKILFPSIKILFASIAFGLAVRAIIFVFEKLDLVNDISCCLISGGFGSAIFLIVAYLLKVDELQSFARIVKSKFTKRNNSEIKIG